MFEQLNKILERPVLFSKYTAETLWTDNHISKQMLQTHLSQDTELASRSLKQIHRVATQLHNRFDLKSKKLCDLGCGPGLYAEHFAELGARVTGIDFSQRSIQYAQQSATTQGQNIDYVRGNYLRTDLPTKQDIITLIYCDLCVLSKKQRETLYLKVAKSLKENGLFILDVLSDEVFESISETRTYELNYMNGFWSENDYIAFHNTYRYEDDKVMLDHFHIIEDDRQFEVLNWFKFFQLDELVAELNAFGFKLDTILEPFDENHGSNSLSIAVRKVR